MTEPTSAELHAAAEAAEIKADILAGLDEAKATLIDAIAKLGIVRLEAEVTVERQKAQIGPITAFTDGEDVRDLAETDPMDFGWGEDHQSYDNLLAFARDYLSAVLAHQPRKHLASGTLYVWVSSRNVVQPFDSAAKEAEANAVRLGHLRSTKTQILAALEALGVVSVEAEYDGEGDEGQISDINAYKADNTTVPLASVAPFSLTSDDGESQSFTTLHDCIEEFAWDVLCHYHEGFENNDGGFGKIVIDVDPGAVRVEHNWRISSSEYTEAEF